MELLESTFAGVLGQQETQFNIRRGDGIAIGKVAMMSRTRQ